MKATVLLICLLGIASCSESEVDSRSLILATDGEKLMTVELPMTEAVTTVNTGACNTEISENHLQPTDELTVENDTLRIIKIHVATERALDWVNENLPKYATREYKQFNDALCTIPSTKSYWIAENYNIDEVVSLIENKEFKDNQGD